MLKRAISALLALVLVLSLLPVQAFATEETAEAPRMETIEEVYINPLYADTLTEEDLVQGPGLVLSAMDGAYLDSLEAVAALVRDQMEQRSETIVVNYKSASVESNLLKAIANEAMKHTGVPTEGDYLRWQYGGAHMSRSYYNQHGTYYSTLTITVTYYTTAAQEQVMDTEVAALLDALGLEGLSDYQTLRAIYDWICANVTYDYDNLTDNTYMLKHSAYAALVNKTAVCQGYAVLLYRLLLEEDIDCRLISGTGNGGPHGWNIVALDGVYYNLDATWDAGAREYDYFLRSPNFPGHIRDAEYETTAFHSSYPMADADYTINCTHETTRLENAVEATCTEAGYTGDLVCADCGTVVTQGKNIPATDHSWDEGTVSIAPTCTAEGQKTYTCECGAVKNETLAVTDHTWNAWNITADTHSRTCSVCGKKESGAHSLDTSETVPPTCTEDGASAFRCSVCDGVLAEVIPALGHDFQNGNCTRCEEKDPDRQEHVHGFDETTHACECGVYGGECGDNLTWILSEDGVLVISGYGNMWSYNDDAECLPPWQTLVETAIIEEGVTSIGDYAFYECPNLGSITIPKSVTIIWYSAFFGCSKLEHITIPYGVSKILSSAFRGCTNLTSVTLPNSLTTIGRSAFNECTSLTNIVIPNSVTSIEEWAFSRCSALNSITIPDNVTSIGRHTFYLCTNLETVTIGNSVTSIGEYAFSGCTSLTDITIPNSVTMLDNRVFERCTALTQITLPESITAIGERVFCDCTSLVSIVIPDSVTSIKTRTFWGCSNLTTVILSDSLTKIEDWAFNRCKKLEGIIIPDGVTHIGESAFCECNSLKNVTLPANLISIDDFAFSVCENLSDVIIPEHVTSIGIGAFSFCTSLKSIVLPKNLTSIKRQTFTHCQNLTNITIPNSVTEIGVDAFYLCRNLTEIYFVGSAPVFNKNQYGNLENFYNVTATAYYPGNNPSWTKEVRQSYGGTITWVPYGVGTERISGKDRHDTAFKIANMMKEVLGIQKFDTILIASGADSADALAGSYLAAVKGAPILLSRNNSHSRNLAYIQENLSENGIVYILGGTGAVPQEMEDLLIQNNIRYERVKGSDRFGTNLEILKKAGDIQSDEILVSTAYEFADSLSASATGKPILLVNSRRKVLTNAQKAYLAEITANSPKTFTIIGGAGAVSDELADALSAYGTVRREKGATREATSVRVAEVYFQNPDTVFLAYSRNFPDGLCGGPLAYAMGAPLLLVNVKQEGPAVQYVAANKITHGYILGGAAAVSDDSVNLIFP